jgi:Mrp family chromosome partitioning ATPase
MTNETLILSELEEKLQQLRQTLRPGQRDLVDWQGGQMAVSAVPGAGKSHSLSVAAAIAINNKVADPQFALAVALYAQGQKDKGIVIARQALALDKNYNNLDYRTAMLKAPRLKLRG